MFSHGQVMALLNLLLVVLVIALAFSAWRLFVLLRAREEEAMRLVIAFSSLIEMKDDYTNGHCARVKNWAADISRCMGLSRRDIDEVVIAAMLHDIGKIGVPDAIINKPGKLDEREFNIIMEHPARGADVLMLFSRFARAADIVRHHHEAMDGSGYPDGLKLENVSLGARIVAVIDAYDAMTSDRSYRRAMPAAKGMAILREKRGTQFDSEVVDVFCRLLTEGTTGRIDPVCGMAGEDSRRESYGGSDYYFCSKACKEEFVRNPVKYSASNIKR